MGALACARRRSHSARPKELGTARFMTMAHFVEHLSGLGRASNRLTRSRTNTSSFDNLSGEDMVGDAPAANLAAFEGKARRIELRHFSDERGTLVPADFAELPF